MEIRPLGNRILVTRCIPSTKTEGGIYIPQNAQAKHQEAEVIAIGPGKWLENGERRPINDLKVGDHILIYCGHEITMEGQEYVFCNADDVLGTVHRNPAPTK